MAYEFMLNKSKIWIYHSYPIAFEPSFYDLKVNDIKVDCSFILGGDIHTKVKKMYNEEQNAQRRQKLGQII